MSETATLPQTASSVLSKSKRVREAVPVAPVKERDENWLMPPVSLGMILKVKKDQSLEYWTPAFVTYVGDRSIDVAITYKGLHGTRHGLYHYDGIRHLTDPDLEFTEHKAVWDYTDEYRETLELKTAIVEMRTELTELKAALGETKKK